MIKRKTTIAIVCILLFLSPFIIIDIMRNFNKPKEAAKHEDDPKGPEEIVEIERYYEPLNSKKYDDTEVLDRCLDIIDRYFENLNKKKYEGAMKLINKTSYEYRNIKIDSFKNIIESKYKTLVGYNLKDFKKVGEGLYLCVLRTSNEQLGEEVYSKNDLFEYEEKMIVDINTELISPNGFIKRLDIDENLFKDELIRVEIKKVYKYLSEIIVDTEVTNLLENEDINILEKYNIRANTDNKKIYFNKKSGITSDYVYPKTMKKVRLVFDINYVDDLIDIDLIRIE